MASFPGFTGYGYDITTVVLSILVHIGTLTNTNPLDYYKGTEPQNRLFNVTAPNWEFIAVGLVAEPGNVNIPCLMRNIETGKWAWSRNIVWFEDAKGFSWAGGNYCDDEATARASFNEYCDHNILWCVEEYRINQGGATPHLYQLLGGNHNEPNTAGDSAIPRQG